MKNHKKLLLVLAIIGLFLFSATELSAENKKLQFNSNKQFKIVQFTDTHFYIGGEKSEEVLQNIEYIMNAEQPDLVILTGDIVTGSGDHWPTIKSWEIITDKLAEYKTPYAVTFGNHDDEAQVSRKELLNYLSKRPYCIISDEGGADVKGIGNYMLPVYNHDGIVEKLIYCLDSRSYALANENGLEGYGWFDKSQINWFAQTNQLWLAKYQNVQSLLFFHIPLPEYKQAFYEGEFKNGVRMEEECSPKINTGMFSEMLLQGNVLGSFVGHDHNNNYVAQLFKISLCYGYFSGGNSYADLPLRGARIILLEENAKTFTTWLRRMDGKVLYKIELPYTK